MWTTCKDIWIMKTGDGSSNKILKEHSRDKNYYNRNEHIKGVSERDDMSIETPKPEIQRKIFLKKMAYN